MSRYELAARNPRYQVFVGWDRPLSTYFLQVYDTLASNPDSQPFTWLGAGGEHLDFHDLTQALVPHAALPLDIAVKLCTDRVEFMTGNTVKLGPTGVFDRGGPLVPGDKGGLVLRFRTFPRHGVVECDFGTPLSLLVLTVDQARGFAAICRDRIKRRFGKIEYSDHDFPMRVEPVPAERVIKVTLPFLCEVLATNPHVFLVLADRLDKAAAELGPLQ